MIKTININYITRKIYVQNTTCSYGARDKKVSSATTGLIATSRQSVENRETKPSTFNKTNKAGTPRRIIVDGELWLILLVQSQSGQKPDSLHNVQLNVSVERSIAGTHVTGARHNSAILRSKNWATKFRIPYHG